MSSSPWRERVVLIHEETLLGTGGTILHSRSFFGEKSFLVAHADNLSQFDVAAFIKRHSTRPVTVLTMMTFETDSPSTCDIVEEDGRGVVVGFHEKVAHPPGNRANGTVYIFEPEIFEYLGSLGKGVIDLSTEVIPYFVGRICAFHNSVYHRNIGTPESLQRVETEFPFD